MAEMDLVHEAARAELIEELIAIPVRPRSQSSIERTIARLEYQMINIIWHAAEHGPGALAAAPPEWGWPLVIGLGP